MMRLAYLNCVVGWSVGLHPFMRCCFINRCLGMGDLYPKMSADAKALRVVVAGSACF